MNRTKGVNPVACTGTSGFLLCPNVLEARLQHPELGVPQRAGELQEVFPPVSTEGLPSLGSEAQLSPPCHRGTPLSLV